MFGALAFVWTGLVLHGIGERPTAGRRAAPIATAPRSWVGLLSWLPVGGMNACCCCTPWTLVAVLAIHPGTGALPLLYGQAAILWNGLFVLASLGLLMVARHRLQGRLRGSSGAVPVGPTAGSVSPAGPRRPMGPSGTAGVPRF